MKSKLLTQFDSLWRFIDNGKFFKQPFAGVFIILAVLNIIIPFYLIYLAIDGEVFDMRGKFIFVFLIEWLVFLFLGWFNLQLWVNRALQLMSLSQEGDEFVAIPVFSHFIQTIGEWLGFSFGIIGFSTSLLTSIFFNDYERSFFGHFLGTGMLKNNLWFIVLWPVIGFLIIIGFRVIAEIYRALASIANNTKQYHGEAK